MRFIPLRTSGGESVSHIGIFVKIRMNKLSKDSDEIAEDANNDEEHMHKLHGKEEKTPTCLPFNGTSDRSNTAGRNNTADRNGTAYNQPNVICQEAFIQCTAEIHNNPFTDNAK